VLEHRFAVGKRQTSHDHHAMALRNDFAASAFVQKKEQRSQDITEMLPLTKRAAGEVLA